MLRCTWIVAAMACSRALAGVSTPGLVPINDLGTSSYNGFQGGLYPGASNAPPPSHATAALEQAALIRPRHALGTIDPANGLIGLISIGMSNTNQEFTPFQRDYDADPTRNPRVVVVNAAKGGVGAESMAPPGSPYWSVVLSRTAAAGLTPEQVQVIWLKQAEAAPPTLDFPDHALRLKDHVRSILNNARDLFPNLRIVYVSSRIYGGYSGVPQRNEPLSYETAFAYKWLIEDQINGVDPLLNFDPSVGPVEAPLVLWGPYLWANGTSLRSDGLVWNAADYEPDNIHPSASGEDKVALMLHQFLAVDAAAQIWNARRPGEFVLVVDADADAYVDQAAPTTNFGAQLSLASRAAPQEQISYVRFTLPALPRPPVHAKLSMRATGNGGGILHRVTNTVWNEGAITYNTRPSLGAWLATQLDVSSGGTLDLDVTFDVRNDPDGVIALALTGNNTTSRQHRSRETPDPPRLVLIVPPPSCHGDANGDGIVNAADLSVLLGQFGQSVSPGGAGDLNNDGLVNAADLSVLLGQFGAAC